MSKLLSRLKESFTSREFTDYEVVCHLIESKAPNIKDAIVISEDPYLLLLIFTALLRQYNIDIHIINPAEGVEEMQRLVYVIKPSCIICTNENDARFIKGPNVIAITGNRISEYDNSILLVDHDKGMPDEYEYFRVLTYSPTPTRITAYTHNRIDAMVDSIVEDLSNNGIVNSEDQGLIPFMTRNPDYLLYFIAFKLVEHNRCTLPTGKDIESMLNYDIYHRFNKNSSLVIPKKEFIELWDKEITPLFESTFIFKLYLRFPFIVNLLIRKQLKRIFKGYNKLLIIGRLESAYIITIMNNLSFLKVLSVYTNEEVLHYGPISYLDKLVIRNTDIRQKIVTRDPFSSTTKDHEQLYIISYRICPYNDPSSILTIMDNYSRYIMRSRKVNGLNTDEEFSYLGDIRNSLHIGNLVFPEPLEEVINSYPFIKYCALLTYHNKLILSVFPQSNILDSNRINYGMFRKILKRSLEELNKKLPTFNKVERISTSCNILERDRNGNVSRFYLHITGQK